MSRESIYKNYKPINTQKKLSNSSAYWFIFKQDEMLVDVTENPIQIPFGKSLEKFEISPVRMQYLGTLNEKPCYSVEALPEISPPENMDFRDLRSLYADLDEDIFLLAGKAIQIVNWDLNHQFCGKCGSLTQTAEDEMAKICPECGFTSFPRLSPAVITAIVKDGKLLMAQHTRTSENMYALIAGFIEAGETLEEAVEREIMEEVGLKVKNIKYFGSQPWPFPNSLMMAFTAEYDCGEIKVDGDEIIDAQWFSADELPSQHSLISISGELIQWYLEKYSR